MAPGRKKETDCWRPRKWLAVFLLAFMPLTLAACAGHAPEVRARGEMAVGFGVGDK